MVQIQHDAGQSSVVYVSMYCLAYQATNQPQRFTLNLKTCIPLIRVVCFSPFTLDPDSFQGKECTHFIAINVTVVMVVITKLPEVHISVWLQLNTETTKVRPVTVHAILVTILAVLNQKKTMLLIERLLECLSLKTSISPIPIS